MTQKALTPEAQGVVNGPPLGWKPTVAEPLPVVRCVQIKKDGKRCNRWSLRSTERCVKHGSQLPNVKIYAEAMVEAARLRLIGLSDNAVDTLENLLTSQTAPPAVQLKAATEILDRIGVRGGFDVQLDQEVTINPAEEVKKKLIKLASGHSDSYSDEPVVELELTDDSIIYDAELTDDEEETD